jgi:hypothetical protein
VEVLVDGDTEKYGIQLLYDPIKEVFSRDHTPRTTRLSQTKLLGRAGASGGVNTLTNQLNCTKTDLIGQLVSWWIPKMSESVDFIRGQPSRAV